MGTIILLTLVVAAGFVVGALVARNNKKKTDAAAQKLENLGKVTAVAAKKAVAQTEEYVSRKVSEKTAANKAKVVRKPSK
jgi:hypothetical protein